MPSPDLLSRPALRAGLLGFGTVGAGTHGVLAANRATIRARAGCAIDLHMVATRTAARARDAGVPVTRDPMALARHPELDVVIETIGGTTVARDCVMEAIAHGKHVVTANKALLALHGQEIFAAASARGVTVGFEGAVAVSIPIVKALREGLVANEIEWLAGIVNGTSNFVLSQMEAGRGYADALRAAQALGYAEADPSLDVGGGDAAHKLALLAAMAFGGPPRLDAVHVEGIESLQPADFAHARRLGCTIKLLAVARRSPSDRGVQLRVHPALIPRDSLLARVQGRMNGILVKGDAAGVTMFYGAGAGSKETASAVVADLVDLARAVQGGGRPCVPPLGFHEGVVAVPRFVPMDDVRLQHCLRVDVHDPDAGQRVLAVLARRGIEARRGSQARTSLVLVTSETAEARMAAAVREVEGVEGVRGVARLRIEELEAAPLPAGG